MVKKYGRRRAVAGRGTPSLHTGIPIDFPFRTRRTKEFPVWSAREMLSQALRDHAQFRIASFQKRWRSANFKVPPRKLASFVWGFLLWANIWCVFRWRRSRNLLRMAQKIC